MPLAPAHSLARRWRGSTFPWPPASRWRRRRCSKSAAAGSQRHRHHRRQRFRCQGDRCAAGLGQRERNRIRTNGRGLARQAPGLQHRLLRPDARYESAAHARHPLHCRRARRQHRRGFRLCRRVLQGHPGARAYVIYASWYQRADRRWHFGGDNNFKTFDYSLGSEAYRPPTGTPSTGRRIRARNTTLASGAIERPAAGEPGQERP